MSQNRPGMNPALAHLVRETDRNRKAALAATVQAEIDAANRAKAVAVVEFNRIAERHDLLLTALIDAGITSLTLVSGKEITLDDLILDDDPKTIDDQTDDDRPEGAEGRG